MEMAFNVLVLMCINALQIKIKGIALSNENCYLSMRERMLKAHVCLLEHIITDRLSL